MAQETLRVVVVGGGIAGLCTAVYALESGYQVDVFEQHDRAGGLATSWRRGDYRFETCLHWLVGSRAGGTLHDEWREVCDIDRLRFVYHDDFVRLEDAHGEGLSIHTNVDHLEAQLLKAAPQDAEEIRHFAGAIRQLGGMPMPMGDESWPSRIASLLKMLPNLPLVWRLAHLTAEDYAARFRHPLLQAFFRGGGDTGRLSVLALVMSLAWMNDRNAGYAIGGAQAVIGLVLDRLGALGGHVRYEAKVAKIVVEDHRAAGVQLQTGEIVKADWVVSAADGYATIHGLLGGAYRDAAYDRAFAGYETFPSYVQVSLGVGRDLSADPGFLTLLLDQSLRLDPETALDSLSFRIFHYDPTFAPPGKTAVTCFLPTRNVAFWSRLRADDMAGYEAEKRRVADAVIAVLERRIPKAKGAVEVVDVSTPATVVRYTGNWRGSMEGWLMTPDTGFGMLPQTLPHLKRFVMAGQWVQPGGGLPGGLMTARAAVHGMCREDHVPFGHAFKAHVAAV